jgi:hypothetical protein
MSKAMGRPPLFRETERPKRFGFLIRPTAYEFEQFVLLLDKCMSENIDRKFFLKDVEFEVLKSRRDGDTVVEQKGTIQILEEWLRKAFSSGRLLVPFAAGPGAGYLPGGAQTATGASTSSQRRRLRAGHLSATARSLVTRL